MINLIKKISSLFLLLAFFHSGDLSAKQVPAKQAAELAKVVFTTHTEQPQYKNKETSEIEVISQFTRTSEEQETYHIFNIAPKGFVVISAEDNYNAVLAFSDESNIDFEDDEKNFALFGVLSDHEQRIMYTREHNMQASASIKAEWDGLNAKLNQAYKVLEEEEGAIVGPLTTSIWEQGTYYNDFCPVSVETQNDTLAPDGGTYAGCTSLGLVQLMKFHEHPVSGNGSVEYIDPVFGLQSADFCNTTYNWDNMPDSLSDYNDDVAELVYHSSVSIRTSFSPTYSEAYVSYVRNALVYNFNYDPSASWFYDGNNSFPVVAKEDLDLGRPLLLTGVSSGGGAHTWVADGYGCFTTFGDSTAAEYFHFNFGWGGDYNGWYLDNGQSWVPLSDQPGTGIVYYYWDRYVVHNVFPAEGCGIPENVNVGVSGITETTAYVTLQALVGEQEISFRYRETGAADWIDTDPMVGYAQLLQGLYPGTEYEYQVRRRCCPDTWSDYSTVFTFITGGELCGALSTEQLSTSGLSETTAYLSTFQPYGDVLNQFRYRVAGTVDWVLTTVDNNYNRYLTELDPATEYEFQVRHECGGGEWTPWSDSQFFETDGSHFEFHGTIVLEGPYVGGGTMSKNLNLNGLIPNEQPFSAAPYFYVSNENLSNDVPTNMVDWVLVEARTGTPSLTGEKGTVTIETHAAMLMSDGSIFGVDKEPGVKFINLEPGVEYYFCVRHRNHLDVLSAEPVVGSSFMSYNYSSGIDRAFGIEQVKPMVDGFFALHAGDYNQDGVIQTTDYDVWQEDPAINNTYDQADGNLDGVVQATDFDTWFPNKAKVGSVEIDY